MGTAEGVAVEAAGVDLVETLEMLRDELVMGSNAVHEGMLSRLNLAANLTVSERGMRTNGCSRRTEMVGCKRIVRVSCTNSAGLASVEIAARETVGPDYMMTRTVINPLASERSCRPAVCAQAMTETMRRKGMTREAMRSERMHAANVHAAKARMEGAGATNMHPTKTWMKTTAATDVHSTEAARMKTPATAAKTARSSRRAFSCEAQRAQRNAAGESCEKQLVHSVSSINGRCGRSAGTARRFLLSPEIQHQ
jgi:hypothetical protein